jgi:hypothetical protein
MRFIRESISKENQSVEKMEHMLMTRHSDSMYDMRTAVKSRRIRLAPISEPFPETHGIGYMCIPSNLTASPGKPLRQEGPASPDYLYRSKSPYARRKICETEFYNRGSLPLSNGMKLPPIV